MQWNAPWWWRRNPNCASKISYSSRRRRQSRRGKSLDEIERAHILRILEECGGNQSRAAEVLDIDRVTLHHKLKRYGWTRTPVESRN